MKPILLTILAASTSAFAVSPSWQEWQAPKDQQAYRVVQYLDVPAQEGSANRETLVVLAAGSAQGLMAGTVFKSYRPYAQRDLDGATKPLWIETGRIRAIDVQDERTVAVVESQGSTMATAFFPKFPQVMAGDLAMVPTVNVSRRQAVTPTVALSYFDIFEDPQMRPSNFELKQAGYAHLRQAARAFADARVSMLMIEGHTDHNGKSEDNQVESYQRALTVRQFLIDELGFDEKRVIAVGYGESEPADPSLAPGQVETNRRIVLKAVPLIGH